MFGLGMVDSVLSILAIGVLYWGVVNDEGEGCVVVVVNLLPICCALFTSNFCKMLDEVVMCDFSRLF